MEGVKLNMSLSIMLQEAAKLGALELATELGLNREYVSKAYAYRRWGRARVDRWIQSGNVSYAQDEFGKSTLELRKSDLLAMASGENMVRFINP